VCASLSACCDATALGCNCPGCDCPRQHRQLEASKVAGYTARGEATIVTALALNNGSTIDVSLAADVYTSVQLSVLPAANVRIHGAGHSIVGSGTHRLLYVGKAATLFLEDLTLANGIVVGGTTLVASVGGGIYVAGGATLTAFSVTITNCHAVYGGGIFMASLSKVTLDGASLVTQSTASTDGGGIVSSGASLVMKGGSSVSACHSESGWGGGISGFVLAFFQFGGSLSLLEGASVIGCSSSGIGGAAILAPAYGLVRLTDAILENNTAVGYAAGIYHGGGSSVTLSNSHIRRCHSSNSGGGGIFDVSLVPAQSTTITLGSGSSITQCSGLTVGGGIVIVSTVSQLIMQDGSFISNCYAAETYGGAIYTIGHFSISSGSYISNCHTNGLGGALNSGADHKIKPSYILDSKIVDNVAGDGGALCIRSGGSVIVSRSEISGNHATGVGGAAVVVASKLFLLAGSVVVRNTAAFGGAFGFTTDLVGESDADGGTSRLFASGPSCAFVQPRLDFSVTPSISSGKAAVFFMQDSETASVVDRRGISLRFRAAPLKLAFVHFCLLPGRSYSLTFASLNTLTGWTGKPEVRLAGPVAASTTFANGTFKVIDQSDPTARYAMHHEFTMGPIEGARALISENLATEAGGGVYLADGAEAYAVETDFSFNVALGATKAGGAVFLGTGSQFEAVESAFVGNNAPNSNGGGLQAGAECVVKLQDSLAANNTAKSMGGFASFSGSASVVVSGSTMDSNRLAIQNSGGEGGAMSLVRVGTAMFEDSKFVGNQVLAPLNYGGALSTRESKVTFEGVVFSRNSAVHGDGGAVAVFAGETSWPAEFSPRCTHVEIIVDWSASMEVCNDGDKDCLASCATYKNTLNSFVNDRSISLCAGCPCASRYFRMANEEGDIPDAFFKSAKELFTVFGERPLGLGVTDSIATYPLCLKSGANTVTAVDDLGDGWWGAELSVLVYDDAGTFKVYKLPTWSGYESAPLEFNVTTRPPSQNRMEANAAPNGGGGSVFWSAKDVTGDAQTLVDSIEFGIGMVGNTAAYGADVATEPTHLRVRAGEGFVAATSQVAVPAIKVTMMDFYDATISSDSVTAIFAHTEFTSMENVIRGGVQIVDQGVAVFNNLAFFTETQDVSLNFNFAAPALPFLDLAPSLNVSVQLPARPVENKNQFGVGLAAFMLILAVSNILMFAGCIGWTVAYSKRVIVKLSQPKYLYYLCGGCIISTLSSVMPLIGETNLSCQLMLWLYGFGFVVTTSTLYIKMQHMEKVIEHSLKMTSRKVKTSVWGMFKVMFVMGAGEVAILTAWLVIAPLEFKRSCITKEKGGVWDGVCTDSVGKCRTTAGVAFVAVLAFWHACCVLAGMHMCYKVRNLPSIMAEGKWVFTGFYSQLQIFVTAVPVLSMVRDDYVTFTLLKSLVICVGDVTTLAMVFLPKIMLVYKYGDFDASAIAGYVSESMTTSTQQDSLYERLRVKKFKSAHATMQVHAESAAVSFSSATDFSCSEEGE